MFISFDIVSSVHSKHPPYALLCPAKDPITLKGEVYGLPSMHTFTIISIFKQSSGILRTLFSIWMQGNTEFLLKTHTIKLYLQTCSTVAALVNTALGKYLYKEESNHSFSKSQSESCLRII